MENPQDVVKAGQEVDVKILRVDVQERKIGLSLKRAQLGDTDLGEGDHSKSGSSPTRGGMDEHGALGTDKIEL